MRLETLEGEALADMRRNDCSAHLAIGAKVPLVHWFLLAEHDVSNSTRLSAPLELDLDNPSSTSVLHCCDCLARCVTNVTKLGRSPNGVNI